MAQYKQNRWLSKLHFDFPLLIFFSLLIYLPVFTTEFGMHNDYYLVPPDWAQRPLYIESLHLFKVGRALQAFLLTYLSWLINRVWDLTVVRVISFLFLLGFVGLFVRFLRRRLQVNVFWLKWLALSIVMLPTSQIYVLWVLDFFPGSFTIFVTMVSYLLLEKGIPIKERALEKPRGAVFFVVASLVFFVSALFIYPPNAVFVFVCSFSILLFSSPRQWPQTLNTIFRDVLFFGGGIIIYLVVNRFFVMPHLPIDTETYSVTGTVYDLEMTSNIFSKITLLVETLVVALGGIWHSVFGNSGAVINMVIIIASCFFIFFCRYKENSQKMKMDKSSIFYRLQVIFMAVGLFLLANAPALMAKECLHLLGYRILFPAAVMVLIGQSILLQNCEVFLKNRKVMFRGCMVGFCLLGSLMAFRNLVDATRNFSRELNFIRQKAALADLKKVSQFFVILLPKNQEETLIERKLPFEFSYMIAQAGLVQPIIDEVARQKNFAPFPVNVDEGPIAFWDPYTCVIDLHDAKLSHPQKGSPQKHKPSAVVTTSSYPDHRVEIVREKGVLFTFQQIEGDVRLSFWQADPVDFPLPWFQIEFQDNPVRLKLFTFCAFGVGFEHGGPVECLLRASQDGKDWSDLETGFSTQYSSDKNFKVYKIINPAPYKKYRFYLLGETLPQPLRIKAIHMLTGT